MGKKKSRTHEPFESKSEHGQFVKIAFDMIDSKAWKELTPYDITVYLYFKRKYHRKTDSRGNVISSNENDITFPKKTYGKQPDQMGYEDLNMNERTFFKAVDHLIELGFIRVVEHGWTIRKPTRYGFSEMWKHYGTEKFKVTDKDRRAKRELSEEHLENIKAALKETNEKKRRKVNKTYKSGDNSNVIPITKTKRLM